jgi:hypothetical protein
MLVRFEVLMALNIKVMNFWDFMVFSLVDRYRNFVETSHPHPHCTRVSSLGMVWIYEREDWDWEFCGPWFLNVCL